MIVWLLASALAAGLVDVGEVELAPDAAGAVVDAREALGRGDFDRAATLYAALAEAGGGVPARLSEAVARYEGGDLRGAERAARAALAAEPGNLPAANLLGLVLVDGGKLDAGLAQLREARARAERAGDSVTVGLAWVNEGLALLDRGDARAAAAAFTAATQASSRADVGAAAAQGLAAVKGLDGTDTGVGPLLARGKLGEARKAATAGLQTATVPRQKVNASLDLAAVERAEGNLDGAAGRLGAAVRDARAAGMMREVALGLGNLGLVYSLGGRLPLAVDALRAGATEARDGGYRVIEADLRVELGLVLVNLGRLDEAEAEQKAAGALLAAMEYPQGVARQAELGGVLAGARGDAATARVALGKAVDWHVGRGRVLDAARVATQLAAALQASDPAGAQSWGAKAEGYFSQAGDPLGAAHVALARALADARASRLEPALAGFAAAAQAADRVGGNRAAAVARVARENASETLVRLGADADVARLAAERGIGELVARQKELKLGFDAYDRGRTAFDGGDYESAKSAFLAARQTFDRLQEVDYAQRARRAAAWAGYNALVALPVAKAYPQWQALVDESAKVDDPELYARAYGAAVLAGHTLGMKDMDGRLAECGRLAERAGLSDVAARCHGALAERDGDLVDRARHARTAEAFAPGSAAAVYALYAVAVDAYNAGDSALALALAKEARPRAGALTGALDELITAASAP